MAFLARFRSDLQWACAQEYELAASDGSGLDSDAVSDKGDTPTIPVIGGTGALGSGLAKRWARSGAKVVIGSRDEGRAQEAAGKIAAESGGDVTGMTNEDAADAAEVV